MDAGEEGFGGFQFVRVLRAPVGGETAFEGGFQQGLAVEAEGGPRRLKALDPLVDLVEHRLDFLHDAALFVDRRDNNWQLPKPPVRQVEATVVDTSLHCINAQLRIVKSNEMRKIACVQHLRVRPEAIHLAGHHQTGPRLLHEACNPASVARSGTGHEHIARPVSYTHL